MMEKTWAVVLGLMLCGTATADCGSYCPSRYVVTVDLYDGFYHWHPAGWWEGRWYPAGSYRWGPGGWYLRGYGFCRGYTQAYGY